MLESMVSVKQRTKRLLIKKPLRRLLTFYVTHLNLVIVYFKISPGGDGSAKSATEKEDCFNVNLTITGIYS